jgi:hypothetical protein
LQKHAGANGREPLQNKPCYRFLEFLRFTHVLLVSLLILSTGGSANSGSSKQNPGIPAQDVSPKPVEPQKDGDSFLIAGPCRKEPCCKPIRLHVPAGKVVSPMVVIKLEVAPNGSLQKVEIIRATHVTIVDRQLREGAGHWCFEKTKEGMSVTVTILTSLMND